VRATSQESGNLPKHLRLCSKVIKYRVPCFGTALLAIVSSLAAQQPLAHEPSDLQVELTTATGSNRFEVGQPIELEMIFSSTAANKYLEPCGRDFGERNSIPSFGLPLCSFRTWLRVTTNPEVSQLQITEGGPVIDVPDRDIESTPVFYSYFLSGFYNFGDPGEYRVAIEVSIGLDGEHAQRLSNAEAAGNPRFVTVKREIVIQVIPKP
jgi:hypothetical protein